MLTLGKEAVAMQSSFLKGKLKREATKGAYL